MTPLRVGEIPFLCAAPFYLGLAPAVAVRVAAAPRALGQLARAGALDAAPLSAVDALALCAPGGGFVPLEQAGAWLGIGARGPVGSVLCFASDPPERWHGRTVQVPPESATSVRLLGWLLARRGVRATLREAGQAPLAGAAARLLIGDAALAARAAASPPPVVDLAEEWWRATALPFVFGLWVARRDVAPEARAALARALHAAARGVPAAAPALADAWRARTGLTAPDLEAYLRGLRHVLGDDDRAGLHHFAAVLAHGAPNGIHP
ncbi:MAG TPA: MqnA/MqnD/SBP family protein [Myxococcota bacterium]|nr:MqnA/MqnD/SBP family protein [Myxococcota bacterium]